LWQDDLKEVAIPDENDYIVSNGALDKSLIDFEEQGETDF